MFSGTLFAILSYLLLIDVTLALTVTCGPSTRPFRLHLPTTTFEFEVIILEFIEGILDLKVFRDMSHSLQLSLALYWPSTSNSAKASYNQGDRWAYINSIDNNKEKRYLLRVSDATAEDAGRYVCEAKEFDNPAGEMISEVWLRTQGILLTYFALWYHSEE